MSILVYYKYSLKQSLNCASDVTVTDSRYQNIIHICNELYFYINIIHIKRKAFMEMKLSMKLSLILTGWVSSLLTLIHGLNCIDNETWFLNSECINLLELLDLPICTTFWKVVAVVLLSCSVDVAKAEFEVLTICKNYTPYNGSFFIYSFDKGVTNHVKWQRTSLYNAFTNN